MRPTLTWPREAAKPPPAAPADLVSSPSNLVLERLSQDGRVAAHRAFMESQGIAILVATGNPKSILTPGEQ